MQEMTTKMVDKQDQRQVSSRHGKAGLYPSKRDIHAKAIINTVKNACRTAAECWCSYTKRSQWSTTTYLDNTYVDNPGGLS